MRQWDQTVDQFVTALHDQANKCKFGEIKDDLIKCILISGVNSKEICEKLLQDESTTTLEDSVKICKAISEAKTQYSKMYNNGNTACEEVHLVQQQKSSMNHCYSKKNTAGHTHQSRGRSEATKLIVCRQSL